MPRPEHLKKPGKYEGKEYADIYPKVLSEKHYILIGERKEGKGVRGGSTERLGDLRLRKGFTEVSAYERKDGTPVKAHPRRLRPVKINEAQKIMESRTKRAVAMDKRRTSKELYDVGSIDSGNWRDNYNKSDLSGVDDKEAIKDTDYVVIETKR